MRIHAPCAHPREVRAVRAAGANEIYCGVVPEQRALGYLNRRPTPQGNLASFEALGAVASTAAFLGMPVAFTLNETFLLEEDYDSAVKEAELAAEAGVTAFVVADPVLVPKLRESGLQQRICASTAAGVANSEAVSFFVDLGVSRVVLPRHLTVSEIGEIVADNPSVEFEVLVLGDPCRFDDAFCSFEHNLQDYCEDPQFRGGGCSKVYELEPLDNEPTADDMRNVQARFDEYHRLRGCGLCALHDLQMAGVAVVKTTARDNELLRLHLLRYLALALESLNEPNVGREEFMIQAMEIRSRMFADFLAGHALALSRSPMSSEAVGANLRRVCDESFLLECEPPLSCYFPEAVRDEDLISAETGPVTEGFRPRNP